MKNGMRKIAREEVGRHERAMHGKKGMRAGGKTNSDMKKYGRGMAKVMNQRSPMRGSSGPR